MKLSRYVGYAIPVVLFVVVLAYAGLLAGGVLSIKAASPAARRMILALLHGFGDFNPGIAAAFVVALIGAIIIAATIAPVLFATRSGDLTTICVSLVLLVLIWLTIFAARSTFDLVFPAVIYLASLTLSAIVFSTRRIVEAIKPGPAKQMPVLRAAG